ncbi:hypothetical protein [Saccharothrix variisporea]|uniref:hypothetical protein n=1 Tax=Saccharothrix variisporea TaxID=543527 RepID=UPI0037CAEF01
MSNVIAVQVRAASLRMGSRSWSRTFRRARSSLDGALSATQRRSSTTNSMTLGGRARL